MLFPLPVSIFSCLFVGLEFCFFLFLSVIFYHSLIKKTNLRHISIYTLYSFFFFFSSYFISIYNFMSYNRLDYLYIHNQALFTASYLSIFVFSCYVYSTTFRVFTLYLLSFFRMSSNFILFCSFLFYFRVTSNSILPRSPLFCLKVINNSISSCTQ